MRFSRFVNTLVVLGLCLMLSACGFHLREPHTLPSTLQRIDLEGVEIKQGFGFVLRDAFTDARSELTQGTQAPAQLRIKALEEGKRVAAYAADLSVRQYLLFIVFDYQIIVNGQVKATQRVKLDKTMNYDANYVLGKQEEERKIRKALREDASRLILLRLKSLSL